jgi:anti-sigma B factor antagonist
MSECAVTVTHEHEAAVATLVGELTLLNAVGVGKELEAEVAPRTETVVLDLAGLTFIDSAGIQLLFRVNRLVGSWQGRLRLVVPPGAPVYRMIRIVDPGGYIPLHSTLDDALAAAATGPSTVTPAGE